MESFLNKTEKNKLVDFKKQGLLLVSYLNDTIVYVITDGIEDGESFSGTCIYSNNLRYYTTGRDGWVKTSFELVPTGEEIIITFKNN